MTGTDLGQGDAATSNHRGDECVIISSKNLFTTLGRT